VDSAILFVATVAGPLGVLELYWIVGSIKAGTILLSLSPRRDFGNGFPVCLFPPLAAQPAFSLSDLLI